MSVVPEHLRRQARVRANGRCEYCRLPDSEAAHPFHIEHIIARRHSGHSIPENLAWACFPCNVAKGTDLTSYDPAAGELTSLFNPRTQKWDDHFEMVDGEIMGKTPVGRTTARRLRVNSEQQIALRRNLMETGQW